jgi:hypothetical protein
MTRDAWPGIVDAPTMFFVLVAGLSHNNLWLLVCCSSRLGGRT